MLALVALPATQEDRGAVVGARQHERPRPRDQARRGAAAEPVDEDDGVDRRLGRLDVVDLGLDALAQRGRLDVEGGRQLADDDLVPRPCREMLHGAKEHVAGDGGHAHGRAPPAPSASRHGRAALGGARGRCGPWLPGLLVGGRLSHLHGRLPVAGLHAACSRSRSTVRPSSLADSSAPTGHSPSVRPR